LRPVMSRTIATSLVTSPWAFAMGVIERSAQYSSPFLR